MSAVPLLMLVWVRSRRGLLVRRVVLERLEREPQARHQETLGPRALLQPARPARLVASGLQVRVA